MSSPIYELLKRPDELFVVEHAHLQPRFVEDSVRYALSATLERYPELADGDFVHSRQVNLETIHRHDVLAERSSTVGELRAELDGDATRRAHRAARLAQRRLNVARTVTAKSVAGRHVSLRALAAAAPAQELEALRGHRPQRQRVAAGERPAARRRARDLALAGRRELERDPQRAEDRRRRGRRRSASARTARCRCRRRST